MQIARVRPFWFLALAAAILLDIFGTIYVLRDVYQRDPVFASVNLATQVENDGSVTVQTMLEEPGGPAFPEGSRLVAVNGKPLPLAADTPTTLAAIEAGGKAPHLTVRTPYGERETVAVERSRRYVAAANKEGVLTLDRRMTMRFAISLATCVVLIACAILLVMRRPRDPVCLLFSFSFLLFAGTIDPPMMMWLGLGLGEAFDVVSSAAWFALVIGIAVFPDGRFQPSWMRWLLVAAPIAAVLLSLDDMPLLLGAVIAFIGPLALLGGVATKYRRYEPGIERQQIKWAAMGFASGLISVAIAFAMVAVDLVPHGPYQPIYALGVLAFFSFGFMLLALGLLVALIRFRLWEADRVIGRSAILAGVALVIGILWAASIDLVKQAIEMALGEDNKAFATALCAVLAAGLFTPIQAFVVKRTKSRFDGDGKRVRNLLQRLAAWRATEGPGEIATRVLAALAPAVHFGSAAIVVDRQFGRELLAARDVPNPETLTMPGGDPGNDPQFAWRFPLEDDDGPIGQFLVGPRSDANRYNEDELANLERVVMPLAEALRTALRRRDEEERVRRHLGAMEERLSRLEGGPDPAAA